MKSILQAYTALEESLAKCDGDRNDGRVVEQVKRIAVMLSPQAPFAGLIRSKLRTLIRRDWHA